MKNPNVWQQPDLWLTILCGLAVIVFGCIIYIKTLPSKQDVQKEFDDNYHDDCKILDFKK